MSTFHEQALVFFVRIIVTNVVDIGDDEIWTTDLKFHPPHIPVDSDLVCVPLLSATWPTSAQQEGQTKPVPAWLNFPVEVPVGADMIPYEPNKDKPGRRTSSLDKRYIQIALFPFLQGWLPFSTHQTHPLIYVFISRGHKICPSNSRMRPDSSRVPTSWLESHISSPRALSLRPSTNCCLQLVGLQGKP